MQGVGCRVQGVGCRVYDAGSRVTGYVLWVTGVGVSNHEVVVGDALEHLLPGLVGQARLGRKRE